MDFTVVEAKLHRNKKKNKTTQMGERPLFKLCAGIVNVCLIPLALPSDTYWWVWFAGCEKLSRKVYEIEVWKFYLFIRCNRNNTLTKKNVYK